MKFNVIHTLRKKNVFWLIHSVFPDFFVITYKGRLSGLRVKGIAISYTVVADFVITLRGFEVKLFFYFNINF